MRGETAHISPETYHLGPGDRLGIYLLGKVQKDFETAVNVEGRIFVPTVGVYDVRGMSLLAFKQLLHREVGRFYDNYTIEVLLLQPKQIQVVVAGDVKMPGKYFLNATRTVLDAVFAAGGPLPRGALRDIRLLRGDSLHARVDLYRFFLEGDRGQDVLLEDGDRVVVPLRRHTVQVSGEVMRPARYELRPHDSEGIAEIIRLAGGFTDNAYREKVEISRQMESGYRTIKYFNYNDLPADGDHGPADFKLRNLDEVKIYSKDELLHPRWVYIFGEVDNPGRFRLEDNMRLSDLVLKAGYINRKAYTLEAEVAQVDPKRPTIRREIDLKRALEGDHDEDILLEEDDQVFIRAIPEWEVGLKVEVRGEVQFPGFYAIERDSTYLSEVLDQAGGFTEDALIREAKLIRKNSRIRIDREYERLKQMRRDEMSDREYQYLVMKENTAQVGHVVVDFHRLAVQGDHTEDVILEDGDIIEVPRAPRVVFVTGRVSKPGGVLYHPGMKFDYYVSRAGGPTWDADARKAKIIKVSGETIDDEESNSLQAGDIVWIPRKPDRAWWQIVKEGMALVAQLATVYLVIQSGISN